MAADQRGVATLNKPRSVEDELSPSEQTNVSFTFPKDVDPKVVQKVVNKMGDMTLSGMEEKRKADAGRIQYMREGGRRFKCIVRSLRPGVDYFELFIPRPSNPDDPVLVHGRCGVLLEEGLTQYAIDCLQYDHAIRTEEIRADYTKDIGLTTRMVKVPHYSVEVIGEVANPKPVGMVGHNAGSGV